MAIKKSYIVEVKAVVTKQLVCNCSEAQAWADPFKYVTTETEKGQSDWEVVDVNPND